MASAVEIDAGTPVTEAPHARRALRAHAWLVALVACLLVGAGFRLVPNSVAAPSAGAGAGSTACAAK
jgi:hypothetical protein